MRILLVEDDRMIGTSLVRALRGEGMAVDWAVDGTLAQDALATVEHDLVLLDLGLPGISGLDLLAMLRKRSDQRPVIILTARDEIETRVRGLDGGADDFVIKPFELDELCARIRSVMRRHAGHAASTLYSGEICLDIATHVLTYRGTSAILSAREFALMQALMLRPGTILSRSQLEEHLYGWGEEVESNAVDVLIHYVRQRFDKEVIRNVRGAGWMVTKAVG